MLKTNLAELIKKFAAAIVFCFISFNHSVQSVIVFSDDIGTFAVLEDREKISRFFFTIIKKVKRKDKLL